METLLTQEQIQAKFDLATKEQVPHYNWLPPTWEEFALAEFKLKDTSKDAGPFENKGGEGIKFIDKNRGTLVDSDPNGPPDDKKWPNPFADFSHLDLTELSDDETEKMKASLQKLKPLISAAYPREAAADAKSASAGVSSLIDRLGKVAGSNSDAMKRLARIFECVAYRSTVLLGGINKVAEAVRTANSQAARDAHKTVYEDARTHFISFLKDLDDREPEKSDPEGKGFNAQDPKKPSAYGRAVKAAYVDPIIHDGRIKGVRIVVKWNPHISSSGYAVPH